MGNGIVLYCRETEGLMKPLIGEVNFFTFKSLLASLGDYKHIYYHGALVLPYASRARP